MNLEAWKVGMEIVKDIYELTRAYPKEELYGLTSQTKRAAAAVPANIVEGMGRAHRKDTIRFLQIARGSLYELDTFLEIAMIIGMIKREVLENISPKIEKAYMLLNGLINYYYKGLLNTKPKIMDGA